MRVGFAIHDITPLIGVELTGFMVREGPSFGVHDPLFAKALVFEDGAERVALVALDLIGLGRNLVRRVRSRVASEVGIPAEAQLFSCTHTHGGPETGSLTTMARMDVDYLRFLEDSLVGVVREAGSTLQPARFGVAEGTSSMGENRVFARKGEVGDIDPAVVVLRISDEAGAPLASVVNYACHAVAGGPIRLTNADYPGCLARSLEAAGCGPTLFVNGPGADVNPRIGNGRGIQGVREAGESLTGTALRLWHDAKPVDLAGLQARSRSVCLPLAEPPSPEGAAQVLAEGQQSIAALDRQTNDPAPRKRLGIEVTHLQYAELIAQYWYGRLDTRLEIESEVQALGIGSIGVVALPGESFSAVGRAIRAAAPGPVIVAGWANDLVGYFADEPTTRLGGYEVEIAHRYYGLIAPFSVEANRRLIETSLSLVDEIGLGKVNS